MARRVKKKRKMWSRADVKALRELAGRKTVKRIAALLKRSVAAVRFKAHVEEISLALR